MHTALSVEEKAEDEEEDEEEEEGMRSVQELGGGDMDVDEPLSHGLGALGRGLMLGLGTSRPESRASYTSCVSSTGPEWSPPSHAASRRGSRSDSTADDSMTSSMIGSGAGSVAGSVAVLGTGSVAGLGTGSVAGLDTGSVVGLDTGSGLLSETGSVVSLESAVLDETDPSFSLLSASHLEAQAAGEYHGLITALQFGDSQFGDQDGEDERLIPSRSGSNTQLPSVASSSYTFVSRGSSSNGSIGHSNVSSYELVDDDAFLRGLARHHNLHHGAEGDFVMVPAPAQPSAAAAEVQGEAASGRVEGFD
eukprot:CAMPEP_0205912724 /NCGR_PEP_ID=MMETSP1325-20131115/6042_1 /ASSEMBLY_ACC=CAM_ASM_000708 /TAXON_ID=236786 /ORGANISM="Florenciella sp., Strain RCC1007" /LENGTH=306 /DNA_ID=CAMNT_0053279479 /DNA_START=271 /DNA_END=1191 /DNA_ORIENTATION=-